MLYRALVGESISQFRHLYYKRQSYYDDGTICPACPKVRSNSRNMSIHKLHVTISYDGIR